MMNRKRDVFIEKMKAKMDEFNAKMVMLEAKADKVSADSRDEYQKQLQALRLMQEATNEKLEELKEASDDAWEDLKAGIDLGWDSLESALKSATSRFQ